MEGKVGIGEQCWSVVQRSFGNARFACWGAGTAGERIPQGRAGDFRRLGVRLRKLQMDIHMRKSSGTFLEGPLILPKPRSGDCASGS